MKRLSLYVFMTAVALGIGVSLLTGAVSSGTHSAAGKMRGAANAAFRDGLYLGKLDASQGNRPHLGSGRWSNDADRRSYIAGYQSGYNQALQSGAAKVSNPPLAEVAGYRDGLADGTADRQSGKPFQLSKNDNYRTALRGIANVETDQERSRHAYRQAYANGYQEAYYGKDHAAQKGTDELSSSV